MHNAIDWSYIAGFSIVTLSAMAACFYPDMIFASSAGAGAVLFTAALVADHLVS